MSVAKDLVNRFRSVEVKMPDWPKKPYSLAVFLSHQHLKLNISHTKSNKLPRGVFTKAIASGATTPPIDNLINIIQICLDTKNERV
jgi:hypothetical protein